jgi:hypothetical protein
MQGTEQSGTGKDLLAERLLRLEERVDLLEHPGASRGPVVHPLWPLALGGAAVVCGEIGMGIPNHPYQYLFAGLLLLLFYHQRGLVLVAGLFRWPLAALNFANMALFFLIVLGGGVRHPFSWFRSPALTRNPPPDGGNWYGGLLPDYSVQWRNIPGISDWTLDITKVQVFLLIATMAGALFRIQGFTSVTALAILIISIPLYLTFNWDWVVPFLVLASASLYLQSRSPDLRR